jgi:predicted phage terminase large subunit-like protein
MASASSIDSTEQLPMRDRLAMAFASPAGLACFCDPDRWRPADHLLEINRRLASIALPGGCRRLVVSCPPRHGKSELMSHWLPAWFLGRYPDRSVILASYEADFAAQWGRKTREALLEHGSLFDLEIDSSSKSASRWGIKGAAGGMQTAGVGGPITGKGASLLVLDDVVKNAEEASSSTYRARVWEWFRSTAYTRIEPDGAVVIIMTRWHEGDLVGCLEELSEAEEGEEWEFLNLPAIDSDGRALWPDRFPLERLEQIRQAVGSYWWSALYQGRPQAASGSIFHRDRFKYFGTVGSTYVLKEPDGSSSSISVKGCRHFQTIDTALKTGSANDYTVCSTFALTPERRLLLVDVVRERLEVPHQWPMIKAQRSRFDVEFQAIEEAGSGIGLIQTAALEGMPLRSLKADRDKLSRAQPISVAYENGLVYHREHAPWISELESELLSFPVGLHDDQVDTLAYGWLLAMQTPTSAAKPYRIKDAGSDRWGIPQHLIDNQRMREGKAPARMKGMFE